MQIEYKNFIIETDGFKDATNFFGKIAKIIVSKNKQYYCLAFAIDGISKLTKGLEEDRLIEKAIVVIKNIIDDDLLKENEYTFQFSENDWEERHNPSWWVKT
jgi:hypothetical protein